MEIEFVVYGRSIGKQRPRFVRRGKYVSTYTPKQTLDYQSQVKKAYQEVAQGKKLQGAIKAEICAIYEPPKSKSKKQQKEMINGNIPYTKKPDSDNILKSILDGLNGIAYDDDSSVDDAHIAKIYGEQAMCQVKLSDNKHAIKPFIKLD